jgi:hypothetical protein
MAQSTTMITIGIVVAVLTVALYFLIFKPSGDTSIVQWPMVNAHSQRHKEGRAIKIEDKQLTSSEFSMSFWMYIADWSWNYGKYKHVFHIGSNSDINEGNIMCRLHPTVNKLIVSANVYPDSLRSSGVYMTSQINETQKNESINVNIPTQKWVNVVISAQDRYLDLYINGELVVSKMLSGVLKNIPMKKAYLVKYGGFKGRIGRVKISNRMVHAESIYSNYRQELSGILMPMELNLLKKDDDSSPSSTTESSSDDVVY